MKTGILCFWAFGMLGQVQALPSPSALANVGAVSALSIALIMLVTKTQPAMATKFAETIAEMNEQHAKTIDAIVGRFTDQTDKADIRRAVVEERRIEQDKDTADAIRQLSTNCAKQGLT